jgi:2-polyprenyl-6-methoxyphenol hydroxylase-like FAD-dependent oxidoreductase
MRSYRSFLTENSERPATAGIVVEGSESTENRAIEFYQRTSAGFKNAVCAAAGKVACPSPAMWDLVIVGAGPGGSFLALALTDAANRAGLRPPLILILEMRSNTDGRDRSVGMNCRTINAGLHCGVTWGPAVQYMKGVREYDLSAANDDAQLRVEIENTTREQCFGTHAPRPQQPPHDVADLLANDSFPTSLVPIRDVERALRAAVEALPNVVIKYETEVINCGIGPCRVTCKDGQAFKSRFLIVADGAKSLTRHRLGIPYTVLPQYASLHSAWSAGILEWNGYHDGWIRQALVPDCTGQAECMKISLMPLANGTGFDVEVPSRLHQKQNNDADELDAYWRRYFSLFGIPKGTKVIGTSRPTFFYVALRCAEHAVVSDSAFLIGDAVRSVHPGTASGMQAAMRDAARFAATYVELEGAMSQSKRNAIVDWYEEETFVATQLLQERSAFLFPQPRSNRARRGLAGVVS